MKKSTLKLFGCLAGLALASSAVAQSNSDYKKLLLQFPDDHAIILKKADKISIDVKDNKLKVSSSYLTECMYLDTKAGFYSEESLEFSKLEKITNIEAGTFVPTSGSYKEIKVKKFDTNDKISNTVFYDGGKSISFMYPSLQPGSKSYLSYTKEFEEPRLLGPHFFQSHLPMLESEYSVTVPEYMQLGWKLFNIADTSYQFTKTTAKGKTTYTWKVKNVKKYKLESRAQDPRYTLPHIVLWIQSYKLNNVVYPFLDNPTSLYSWYYTLTKDANKEDSPEMKRIVDSITAGVTDDLEKVKIIYYWVQDNIKYIAFEDGMGGFIPRSGKSVCEKRYGDCKDMASIITKMLSYAGVPAYLTWIGTRSIPYRYEEVPTPLVDNHMIAAYKHNGNYYFLDGTGKGTPYNTPTAFIQGKQALLGIDSNKFEIVEVPVMPSGKNQYKDSVEIFVENTKIIGKGHNSNSGYYNTTLSYKLEEDKRDRKQILKDYFNKSSNKFLIDSVKVKNIFGREKPVEIDYTFNIDSYVQQNGDESYINMHLDKDYANDLIDADRKQNIEREHTSTLSYITKLNIPKGYAIEYVPTNSKFDQGAYHFSIAYAVSGKNITLTKKISIDELVTEKKDFDTWNKMIKELKKAYSEVVIIKKVK